MQIVGLDEELGRLVQDAVDRALVGRVPVAWLDVEGAAQYCAMTPEAIRTLAKRNAIPVTRTPTGRLRFRPEELDEWMRSAS